MKFIKTQLEDAYLISMEQLEDERGFFARTWCTREFSKHGLAPSFVQCSISFNHKKGTLRGMHFQIPPHEETKLVRVTTGAIFDVIVDMRPSSKTYLQHLGVELNAENRTMLYIPKGFAHGFITLRNNSEIFYQMSEFFVPDASRGIRWNDPALNIQWPEPVAVISKRDEQWPDFFPSITT
jgi:dTDP-4-dehydrorhamnose 3,5-epimerase